MFIGSDSTESGQKRGTLRGRIQRREVWGGLLTQQVGDYLVQLNEHSYDAKPNEFTATDSYLLWLSWLSYSPGLPKF